MTRSQSSMIQWHCSLAQVRCRNWCQYWYFYQLTISNHNRIQCMLYYTFNDGFSGTIIRMKWDLMQCSLSLSGYPLLFTGCTILVSNMDTCCLHMSLHWCLFRIHIFLAEESPRTVAISKIKTSIFSLHNNQIIKNNVGMMTMTHLRITDNK